MAAPVDPALRKRVLKVIFISLLLDLISFTFILPLFPKLIEFYRGLEASSPNQNTLLAWILRALNSYKSSFSKPIDSRYDVVLLGGALGSLFSALQAIASPIIGILSDKYGRRKALLVSLAGNILSVLCWVMATDFRTFLASRIIGGISEGNVQLATSMATDISDEKQRGSTMAIVGACFCVSIAQGLNVPNEADRSLLDRLHIWSSTWSILKYDCFCGCKSIRNCSGVLTFPRRSRNHLRLCGSSRDPPISYECIETATICRSTGFPSCFYQVESEG